MLPNAAILNNLANFLSILLRIFYLLYIYIHSFFIYLVSASKFLLFVHYFLWDHFNYLFCLVTPYFKVIESYRWIYCLYI